MSSTSLISPAFSSAALIAITYRDPVQHHRNEQQQQRGENAHAHRARAAANTSDPNRATFQSSSPSSIIERHPSTLTGVNEPISSEAAPISTTCARGGGGRRRLETYAGRDARHDKRGLCEDGA
jgi:hypothetical protein